MTWRLSTSSSRGGLRFAVRCTVYAVLAVMAYGMLYMWRPTDDAPPEVDLFRQVVADGAQVLYFGDSTLFFPAEGDADTATMPEMLQGDLPDRDVRGVYSAAYGMEVYAAYAQALARNPGDVKAVVIPVNLRLMAPQLEEHPYRRFDKEKLFLRHDSSWFRAAFRPLSIFQAFDLPEVDADSFEGAPILHGDAVVERLYGFHPDREVEVNDEQRRQAIEFFFMANLHVEDAACRDLADAADALQSAGIKPIFYATPIDVETCRKYAGDDVAEQIRSNLEVVRGILAERNVELLDLTFDLPSTAFNYRMYPNQHLKDTGRAYVTERIAEALRESLL
jgi:hypothetical protein